MSNINFFLAIILFAAATQINGDDDLNGRLLTPEEGCGLTKVKNTRIVGGSKAADGAWPWMALLAYFENYRIEFLCGGTLITTRHVLTAAHCVEPDLIFVRLAEYELSHNDGQHLDVPIARSVPHEAFDASMKANDIAMLYLQRDVKFSDKIRPICLPLDEPLRSRSFVGDNPFVIGFGRTSANGNRAQVLMQVQVPVVDTTVCRELHRNNGGTNVDQKITEHVICAGGIAGKGFWKGDSGGSLVIPIHKNGTSFPFYQIGIISYSLGCARENVPAVYTNVQFYSDWIKEHVKQK